LNAKYSDFSEFIDFWNKSSKIDDTLECLDKPNDLKSAFDVLQIAKNS
jgi:hypothetical protein